MGETKIYSAFLSLSILEETQCLAESLQYVMSENEYLNSSCTATAGNETFHGRLKSYLAGDEIVIRCTSTLDGFVQVEKTDTRVTK